MRSNVKKKIQSWDLIPSNTISEVVFDRDNGTLGIFFEEYCWAEFESIDPQMSVYFVKVEGEDEGEERTSSIAYEELEGKVIMQMITPFHALGYPGVGFIRMTLEDKNDPRKGMDVILRSEVDNVPIRLS